MNLSKNLTRPRLAIALGIIAVLATLVVVLTALSTPRTIPNAATVRRGDLNASITATGKVRAKRSAKLSLPQSGIVASISKAWYSRSPCIHQRRRLANEDVPGPVFFSAASDLYMVLDNGSSSPGNQPGEEDRAKCEAQDRTTHPAAFPGK